MRSPTRLSAIHVLGLFLTGVASASAHDPTGGEAHPHDDQSAPEFFLAQATQVQAPGRVSFRPDQAAPFEAFAPRVKVRWDEKTLFVESGSLPAHGMMIGITSWQQQVPLPQNYTGANSWQFPRMPVPAKAPASIKGRFLRGAIALAVNGIPIFNPQNNRGELSAEIGELDAWGGHCGRADDYHYHAAPLHLQKIVGPGQPIAYALDGYSLYGLTEPDGSAPAGLDDFNGHSTPALGYHYHASNKYPYVNGGFHGEVVERGGQVDPQPRAQPLRAALPPLRGAKITGFSASSDEKTYALQYWLNGKEAAVKYASGSDGSWTFQFTNADGAARQETYRVGELREGGADRSPRKSGEPTAAESVPTPATGKAASLFVLRSPDVADGGTLPVEYTGDGPGSTLPLEWSGAPAATRSFALLMHHLDREGTTKYYWVLYDLPGTLTHLAKNSTGTGTLGSSFKRKNGYEPPHSQGPGAKTYVLTLYALSAVPQIPTSSGPVTGEALAAAIKNSILASSDLHVVYSRDDTAPHPPSEDHEKARAPIKTSPAGEAMTAEPRPRPNFLVIMGEAQGWASSSVQMDDDVPNSRSALARTPSLERLAAEGMRFANFYAASPRCTPTRAAFFTGRSPAALHMTFVGEGPGGGESSFSETGSKLIPAPVLQELPESETTIAEMLKQNGYATAHFGKWHVGRGSPAHHGFEESDGPNNNGGPENVENPNPKQAFEITERGMEFLERQAKAGKPFYLQVSHYPGRGGTSARPETYAEVRKRANSERDQRLVGSAAVTEDMDATIGFLLAKLDALGIADRTYCIYTSDHGAQGRNANGPLANGKGTVWEGGIRVPLILRGPAIKPGACTHIRASTVDLFPTIAALAGVKEALPPHLEGGSLSTVLGGEPDIVVKRSREEFVVHFPHYDKNEQGPASVLLLGTEKLIRFYENGGVRLFDLGTDVGEQRDLAMDRSSEAATLNRRLSEYLNAVGARMPTPNPKFDPAVPQSFRGRPNTGRGTE